MKKPEFWTRLLLDWFLLLPGVLGSLLCLITAFSLPEPEALWGTVFLAVTGSCLALGHKKWDRITAPALLGVLLALAYLQWETLAESFRNLWTILSSIYAKGYNWVLDLVPREPVSEIGVAPALLALAVGESFLGALSVRTWRRTTPAALALALGILPCFVLTDTPPALLPLLAAVFSILTQALTQSVRRREGGEEGKSLLFGAALAAALLGLALWVFPKERYTPPISWDELTASLSQWGEAQNNRGIFNAGLMGNPASVDLTRLGALPSRATTALYVRSSRGGPLYLRGSSYTAFDGSVWTRGPERDWDPDTLYPTWSRRHSETLRIQTTASLSLYYTTYEVTALPADGEQVSDAWVRNPAGSKDYTLSYQPGLVYHTEDPTYETWVRETCLGLPDQTREAVLDWWAKKGGDVYRITGRDEDFVRAVADRVALCARYSRNPLRMPEGRDFCGWFLEEAEEGYCVHFATSCAALLRALGIPTRYVTGYVCETDADVTEAVSNLQAHAWVEAWVGGRWIVVEPTPGNATEFSGISYFPGETRETGLTEPTDTQEVPTEAPVTEPPVTTTEPRSTSDTLPPLPDKPSPTNRPNQGADPQGGGTDPGGAEQEPVNLTPLWFFLGLAGLLALILGRRALALRRWETRLARAPANERARLLWRRIRRLQKLGGDLPPEAEALAKKAAFSQHTLTDEELTLLQTTCDAQAAKAAGGGFWKQMYCKYVLAII